MLLSTNIPFNYQFVKMVSIAIDYFNSRTFTRETPSRIFLQAKRTENVTTTKFQKGTFFSIFLFFCIKTKEKTKFKCLSHITKIKENDKGIKMFG